MTDENAASAPSQWLLEPPGSGEVNFRISVGSDVELSSAAREALETLLAELQGDDVSGFSSHISCPSFLETCNPFTCTLTNCQPMTSRPCLADMDCHVAQISRRGGFGL
ncbi:MAG TPA: hypothetical protein VGP92_18110 [Acidimicrobiia bacterium]|jgi:hypothetical protein|nr:hypothetical protein [Acidimicrobiia bacterium]